MNTTKFCRFSIGTLIALGAAGAAFAAPNVITNTGARGAGPILDFANATPMMPFASPEAIPAPDLQATMDALANPGPSVGGVAGGGGKPADHLATTIPKANYTDPASFNKTPEAYGTSNLHFTTSRSATTLNNQKAAPLRYTGRLYFQTPSGTSWCSASMIRPAVLVTAAHCMNSGTGTWYTGWTYVPAYRDGAAPYGVWSNWVYGQITVDWLNGGGGVPNLRDFAVLVFDRDGRGNRVGDYTGHMGWWTNRLIGRHVTTVGYPGNMYKGETQMRTDSLAYNIGGNNVTWGSDQRGGSSGSPLVVNLRNGYNNSVITPTENQSNRVSGVISWGYISAAPMEQGASVLDSVFATMVSDACSALPTLAC